MPDKPNTFAVRLQQVYRGGGYMFFDGGMGTMIQRMVDVPYSVPEELLFAQPEAIRAIHEAYIRAGADVITTNTFGASPRKLAEAQCAGGKTLDAAAVMRRAVSLAREAADRVRRETPVFVAADIGPLGVLMEPLGPLSFDEAYDNFAVQARAAEDAGADLVIIETMSNLYEVKAALLAVKEQTALPAAASVSFQDDLRMLTGADAETAAVYMGALGAAALGFNCGGSLEDARVLTGQFVCASGAPVLVQPNAGLPVLENGRTVFKVAPAEFGAAQRYNAEQGAVLLGGCCGTTPEHIAEMIRQVNELPVRPRRRDASVPDAELTVCSGTRTVRIGGSAGPVIIGERINPTGKKKCKAALAAKDAQFILDEAQKQIACGAHILDVNVGLPELDETETMLWAVRALQKTFDVPLQLDSSEAAVLERALRYYNGKPLINSVSGKQEVMDAVFPLAAKYGCGIVALTLDEAGIPPTAEGRVQTAVRIIAEAAAYGIPARDILIDTLTLTVSSQQDEALETLLAIEALKTLSGEDSRFAAVKTVLGVSNISFGLPRRDIMNAYFLGMALYAGLDACIINPLAAGMTQAFHAYRALAGFDANCLNYISLYKDTAAPSADAFAAKTLAGDRLPAENGQNGGMEAELRDAIMQGFAAKAVDLTHALLKTLSPLDIIDSCIVAALDEVGRDYETGRKFLPQLLLSADTVSQVFEVLKAALAACGSAQQTKGTILLATVYGDIHDIGKNIVRALLENYGYAVIDLGKNVPIEQVAQQALAHDIRLVGLSALMTTTVSNMEKTIQELRRRYAQAGKSCVIMAGGAVLTEAYAKQIGADYYVKDAMASVAVARRVFEE